MADPSASGAQGPSHGPSIAPAPDWRGPRLTRRAFLARGAALGICASVGGSIMAACGRSGQPSGPPGGSPGAPASPFDRTPPVVEPTPVSATYGPMLGASELVPVKVPAGALTTLLAEITGEAGLPIGAAVVAGRHQAQLSVALDGASLSTQAYRLDIAATDDGPSVAIRAGDAAGALNGFLSLARLAAAAAPGLWLRTAHIADAPGFARRGAILDPAPLTGVTTPSSRAQLLDRVRLGVRHKLNFVMLPGRVPWPALVEYCDDHYIELMVAWGFQDQLTQAPRQQLKEQLAVLLDAGVRSISLNWDDIGTSNPEALADAHGRVFVDLYDDLRRRQPDVLVSAVLPPYGGIPGQRLVGSSGGTGERYLAAIRGILPADVRVFWTGDGGVFSPLVSAAGARAYADAVGHEIGLWDNDAITFSRGRRPCTGRAADLPTVVRAYMGNLAGEANWDGSNGEFALLTTLFYTWNPASYNPIAAASSAEEILAGSR